MAEKLTKKITGQNLLILEQTKEGFLIACQQYEHLGKLLTLQAKTIMHPDFKLTSAPEVHSKIVTQHFEIGEQLKNIGEGLDALGGKAVLQKPDIEVDAEVVEDEQTFVSNIKPKEEEEEEEEKKG